ncbi:hypothetical protein, partial [Candidatus Villigracilis proximus]|uniref:hypothetical protein n=1 Tax=Candidatus Villigracilis proximus TaxID=3140683 RepID=UPI0031E94D45
MSHWQLSFHRAAQATPPVELARPPAARLSLEIVQARVRRGRLYSDCAKVQLATCLHWCEHLRENIKD